LECRNCPYIKDELYNWADYWYESEYNDYETYKEIIDDKEEYCWCDKVGYKTYAYACSDAYSNKSNNKNRSNKKKRNKYERDLKYKNHLKYLADNVTSYPQPAYPVDKYGWYSDNPQEIIYYKRQYRYNHGNGRTHKYYKRYSNKKIRQYKEKISDGSMYRKIFDLWWTLY